ncbi:hypothetical protein JQS43_01110 [Natronosporangium hydrolyticum]|uniref:Uncharacterized protein n=1 Tax=Natronosporangium hydrolyticum TaxID=2811111 RepID=A0A895YM99_9ACTN|nr:hypothetical protein [Natronosporangium hydrolyticum]QSB15018.1 hypothetical protein JQS43_01110 [Natronosporangium hydrolyticum]
MSQTPYDAVLQAARGLPEVETALAAEMLGASLLGSVYAIADGERADAVREFVGGFLTHTARRRTPAARATRSVFAALVPQAAGAGRVRPGPNPPPWAAQLGKVRLLETWAYGDVYGDQTSYLATFAYDEPGAGGGEHALVILVDHNIGIVKDLFVGEPADKLLDEVRRAADSDDLVWLKSVPPAVMRTQVEFRLEITDNLSTLPDGGSLATDRLLASARLATFPQASNGVSGTAPFGLSGFADLDPAELLAGFLAAEPGRSLTGDGGPGDEAVRYSVQLILDFVRDSPEHDPLRWSPAVAGLFLLDWVHRRAVLNEDDVAALPQVLRAWVAWSARQRELPAAAAAATDEAIEMMTPEFVRLHGAAQPTDPPSSIIPRPR